VHEIGQVDDKIEQTVVCHRVKDTPYAGPGETQFLANTTSRQNPPADARVAARTNASGHPPSRGLSRLTTRPAVTANSGTAGPARAGRAPAPRTPRAPSATTEIPPAPTIGGRSLPRPPRSARPPSGAASERGQPNSH